MRSFMRFIITISISILALSGCANLGIQTSTKAQVSLTPVTEHSTGKSHPGKFIWHDLVTPDPVAAGDFYKALFGWKVDYQDDYAVVRNGDKLIAGILKVKPKEGREKKGVWLPSVSVTDVDAAAKLVTTNGGSILKGPADMGQRGRAVLISDSQHADLVLLDTRNNDPEDSPAAIGDWLWDEVWTDNPEATEAFYAEVVGYDQMVSSNQYDVFMHSEKMRAGLRHVDSETKNRLWVPVVRVADPELIIQRVAELGGHVLLRPNEAPSTGDTALIADPTGALLLVQRWPSQTTVEGK